MAHSIRTSSASPDQTQSGSSVNPQPPQSQEDSLGLKAKGQEVRGPHNFNQNPRPALPRPTRSGTMNAAWFSYQRKKKTSPKPAIETPGCFLTSTPGCRTLASGARSLVIELQGSFGIASSKATTAASSSSQTCCYFPRWPFGDQHGLQQGGVGDQPGSPGLRSCWESLGRKSLSLTNPQEEVMGCHCHLPPGHFKSPLPACRPEGRS